MNDPRPGEATCALRFTVAPELEDLASYLLWEAGTLGVELRPTDDGPVELIAYFPQSEESPAAQALGSLGILGRSIPMPSVDWVARFREGFRGFHAGRFRIEPAWSGRGPGPATLVVNPGRAFGTGTHETTRLCLAALESLAAQGPLGALLDLGTGSGLLAIAALRLGAGFVVASDLDPEALEGAREHAALNGVSPLLVRADGTRGLRPASFDVVVANLTTPLLLERRDEILGVASPGASLVLAGLLSEDEDAVRTAYAFEADETHHDGEWSRIVGRVPS